ncbi:hypothetical protein V6N13_138126 [Hibiscus sabdariffa]|uniref:Uncharacterized protein n=1 Tax=Hibiscus sabdariffa TaxID=183260 RepID=A0ABR2QCK2_9ROSI
MRALHKSACPHSPHPGSELKIGVKAQHNHHRRPGDKSKSTTSRFQTSHQTQTRFKAKGPTGKLKGEDSPKLTTKQITFVKL